MLVHRMLHSINKILRPVDVHLKQKFIPLSHAGIRQLSLRPVLHHKIFVEYENKFAYDLLESKGYVKPFSFQPIETTLSEDFDVYIGQDWSQKSPQELYEAFAVLSKYCSERKICISTKVFDNFIDNLTDKIQHLDDAQLESVFLYLKMWPETESVRTRNFIEVWAALDDACLARHNRWPVDKRLSFAALTFHLSIARTCDYTIKCVQKMAQRAESLTPAQVVQACFYMGVMRIVPHDKHNLEIYLQKNFTKFTIDDLAVISMGYFKTKSPIRSLELMNTIIAKIITEIEEIDSVSLSALLKLVRYSFKHTQGDTSKLLEALEGEVARLSVMACVHVALLCSTTLTHRPTCLARVAERVAADITTTRMKDLERLTLAFAIFDFRHPTMDFVALVLDELRKPERRTEIEMYGRSYACCVMYATMLGYYPQDLIDHILDRKFLSKAYGDHPHAYGREILALHNTVDIHCPDYTGNRLQEKIQIFLGKKYTDYMPNEDFVRQYNASERLILDIVSILRKFCGGKSNVHGDHAITHYQRGDIYICLDKNGKSVDISTHFPIKPFGMVKKAPTDDTWIAFVIAGKYAYIKDTEDVIGPFKTRCRELRKIGYHPVIVAWYIWSNLKSEQEKIDYIQTLIKEAVKT